MQRSSTYRLAGALSLLSIFLLFFLGREAHQTFGHDHVHPKCAAQGATQHLHSPEFAPEDCLVCHLSIWEWLQEEGPDDRFSPPLFIHRDNFRRQQVARRDTHRAFHQRGPPAC